MSAWSLLAVSRQSRKSVWSWTGREHVGGVEQKPRLDLAQAPAGGCEWVVALFPADGAWGEAWDQRAMLTAQEISGRLCVCTDIAVGAGWPWPQAHGTLPACARVAAVALSSLCTRLCHGCEHCWAGGQFEGQGHEPSGLAVESVLCLLAHR